MVIVGTGPAGCAAATVLSRAGVDVCLLGPTSSPQLKVGESLPAAAQRLLRTLGVNALAELLTSGEYLPCVAQSSAWGEAQWRSRDALCDPEGPSWHLLRHRFDAALLRHALCTGAGHTVGNAEAVEAVTDGYRLRHRTPSGCGEIHAKFLIDASGRSAWLVRRLGSVGTRSSEQYAAVAWLHGTPSDADDSTRVRSVADGWWYTARLPQGLRVLAFHGLRRTVGRKVRESQSFLDDGLTADILPPGGATWGLAAPAQAHDAALRLQARFTGSDWLAVGDAALALDPLAAQGLFFALYSGIRGAQTVLQATGRDAPSGGFDARPYEAQVRNVYLSNARALKGFAWGELRFPGSAYWRQRQANAIKDAWTA